MNKLIAFIFLIVAAVAPARGTARVVSDAAETETPGRENGRMVWIPDSMAADVETLLKGHSRVVDDLCVLTWERRWCGVAIRYRWCCVRAI